MKPTVREVLPLVRAYCARPGNGAGGSLHVVLDDGNVDDGSVEFCLYHATTHNDGAGMELAATLLQMSKTQRRKLSRMVWVAK